MLLSGGNDNTLRRWEFARDPKDPHFVTVFRGHGGWIRGCVLAADSRYAASGSLDGSLKLWDAEEYEEVRAPARPRRRRVLGGVFQGRPANRHGRPRPTGAALEPRQSRAAAGVR